MIFSGDEIVEFLEEMRITHVVWVPDSTLGEWEPAMRASPSIRLITVCREGEAWALAAGLYLGGARPLVMIQCTGFFESGDSLRVVLHDYELPLFAIIGYRSYLNSSTLPGDTCLNFTEPLLEAWKINHRFIDDASKKPLLREHFLSCLDGEKSGAILLAEGRA